MFRSRVRGWANTGTFSVLVGRRVGWVSGASVDRSASSIACSLVVVVGVGVNIIVFVVAGSVLVGAVGTDVGVGGVGRSGTSAGAGVEIAGATGVSGEGDIAGLGTSWMSEDHDARDCVGHGAGGVVKFLIGEGCVEAESSVCRVGDLCRCRVRLLPNSCNARSATM